MADDLGDGLRARIEELEAENEDLRLRVQDLEGDREIADLLGDSVEVGRRKTAEMAGAFLASRIEAVLAIDAADHATTSRDYGRGFADALHQVRLAIGGHR